MSADIGPGDWVECVDITPGGTGPCPVPLTLGGLYLVDRVFKSPWPARDAGMPLVALVGAQPYRGRAGFYAFRFRPVYRPKADLITSLSTPMKEKAIA